MFSRLSRTCPLFQLPRLLGAASSAPGQPKNNGFTLGAGLTHRASGAAGRAAAQPQFIGSALPSSPDF